jgi:high-affinity K+ transport system ATPase subunit B
VLAVSASVSRPPAPGIRTNVPVRARCSLDVAQIDRLRVRPGEGCPVDGAVESGSSSVDESMITGAISWASANRGVRLRGPERTGEHGRLLLLAGAPIREPV